MRGRKSPSKAAAAIWIIVLAGVPLGLLAWNGAAGGIRFSEISVKSD